MEQALSLQWKSAIAIAGNRWVLKDDCILFRGSSHVGSKYWHLHRLWFVDVDARDENGLAVLNCRTTSTIYVRFDSTYGAGGHVPDSGGRAGTFQSRLDYGNAVLAGLPAYLQRRLQSMLNAPQNRRSYLPPLVACSAAYLVQVGCVLTYKFLSSQALRYLRPLVRVAIRQPAWPASTPLCQHRPWSVRLSWICRRPSLSGRCTSYMERSAQCYSIWLLITTLFPVPPQDLSFQWSFPDIIWHLSGPCNSLFRSQ